MLPWKESEVTSWLGEGQNSFTKCYISCSFRCETRPVWETGEWDKAKKNVMNKFMVYDGMENAFSHFSNAHKKWVSEHAGWNLMGWALSYYYHFNQKCIYANVMAFRETKKDLARTVCAWGWSDVHTTQSEMLSWDDSQTKRKVQENCVNLNWQIVLESVSFFKRNFPVVSHQDVDVGMLYCFMVLGRVMRCGAAR